MREDIRKKLDLWYEEIKGFERLSIKEAKILNEIMLESVGETRDKYRERLILGTLYLVYEFVVNSGFCVIKSSFFDIEDIISISNEVWINIIDSGKLLETKQYNLLFNETFYSQVIQKLIGEKPSYYEYETMAYDRFGKILFQYMDDINKGIVVDYKRCEYYLNNFTNLECVWRFSYNRDEYKSEIYLILSRIASVLDIDPITEISSTRLRHLKNIIMYLAHTCNDVDRLVVKDFSDRIIDNVTIEELMHLIDKEGDLNDNEKKVLFERFWNEISYRGIAKDMDRTIERVRQIEGKALRKLNKPKIFKQVKAYYKGGEL